MVAVLCNDRRAAPKTHDRAIVKLKEKLCRLKYERMKLRHALLATNSKYKKQKVCVDEDAQAVADTKEGEGELAEEGKPVQGEDVLCSWLSAVEDEFARPEKARGTGKATLKRDKAPEKLFAGYE